MLDSIELIGEFGSSVVIPVSDTSTGYILKNLEGLGPGQSSFFTSDIANVDGNYWQGGRVQPRNLLLTLGLSLYSELTVSDLRKQMYKVAPLNSLLTMRFTTLDNTVYRTTGHVESLTPVIFTNEPEISLSVVCEDPLLYSGEEFEHSFATNPYSPAFPVTNEGTNAVGFTIDTTVPVGNNKSQLTIIVEPEGRSPQQIVFSFLNNLQPGDSLSINTKPGSKSALVTRSSTATEELGRVSLTSATAWPLLYPGNNTIGVQWNPTIPPTEYTLRYSEGYGGL